MDIIDIVLSKKYTDESLKGITGTLAGKNCTIKSATKADGVTTVVFAWTADDGTEKTTTIQVNDGAKGDIGIGIDNVTINANSHLIVTLSDGSTIDAGLIQGGSGTDDYEDLINRPKIEGVDLIGNKTFEDLGVASATDLAQTDGHLQDLNESLEVLGKCKNLLNPTLETTTLNGVTCTNNGDGTYTLSGTATADSYFNINKKIPLEIGKTYKLICYDKNIRGWPIIRHTDKADIIADKTNNVFESPVSKAWLYIVVNKGTVYNNVIIKPMLTTNLSATYDDFVPYTGDGETLASDVAEIKNDLGGLSFSASGTTLSITDGTNTWTLKANS